MTLTEGISTAMIPPLPQVFDSITKEDVAAFLRRNLTAERAVLARSLGRTDQDRARGEPHLRALQDMPISFPRTVRGLVLQSRPYAVHIGHGIYWYGIILAICWGLVLCMKQAKRYGSTEDNVLIWCCGRAQLHHRRPPLLCDLLLVLYRNADGSLNWGEMVAVWDGGLAIYGAVIAAP